MFLGQPEADAERQSAGRFDAFNDDELAAIHRGVDLIPSPAAQSLAEEVYQARLVRVAR